MNHEAILTAREQYETDEAFIAAANAEQVSYVEAWIRYTTIAAQFGDAVAESLYAMLAATAPGKAAAFINPGFDMQSEVTRQAMRAIADTTPEAAPVIAWCLQQGRVVTRPCEAWGVGELTQAVLDEARRRAEMADMDIAVQARVEAYYEARATYIRDGGERPGL